MTDEEYTTEFLQLLRYVPYLTNEKEKIQRFIIGFPLSFEDWIKLDEPLSLEESIKKLKHCYGKSKCKPEFKHDWKGSEKTKGKWPKKLGRSHDPGEK